MICAWVRLALTKQRIVKGLGVLCRLGLGAALLGSAIGKIRQPHDFLSQIYEYELVGPKVGLLVAMVVPWLQLFSGVCLLGGIFVGGALVLSAVLMVSAMLAMSSAFYHDLAIGCRSFAVSGGVSASYGTLVITGLLFFVAVACYVRFLAGRHLSEGSETHPESASDNVQPST